MGEDPGELQASQHNLAQERLWGKYWKPRLGPWRTKMGLGTAEDKSHLLPSVMGKQVTGDVRVNNKASDSLS